MLVSFSVKNYRSFAEKQTLSLVAGASAKKNHHFAFKTGNSFAPNLLRSTCLLGANGAGKSSLVKAMDFFRDMVIRSIKNQVGDQISITSHLLRSDLYDQPSEFEIIFIHGQGLYQYGFSVDKSRVWSEWLLLKPNKEKTATRKLFEREYNPSKKEYDWYINSTFVKGEKKSWKNQTASNVLFLSRAVQLNAEDLEEPFNWIRKYFRIIESPSRVSDHFTSRQCLESETKKKQIISLLKSVGLKIENFEVERQDRDISKFKFPDNVPQHIKEMLAERYVVKTYHTNNENKAIFLDLDDDESDGTNVLYCLSGILFDVLENGYTLVVDELHNSLHPHALKTLIGLFHNLKINKNNAQLIFTSHETSVMTKGFMHQEQLWLTEKTDNDSTQLIPLSDYKIRDLKNFQKAYLDGRYGGTPNLKEFTDG